MAQPTYAQSSFPCTSARTIGTRSSSRYSAARRISGESFQRLFPVRIATMHARLINWDDELLLLVETKRVLRAIGTT